MSLDPATEFYNWLKYLSDFGSSGLDNGPLSSAHSIQYLIGQASPETVLFVFDASTNVGHLFQNSV